MTPEALAGEALELADAVAEQLRGHGRVGVAYSEGVDSATLLALAVRALGGENVVALLGVSPSLARRERRLRSEERRVGKGWRTGGRREHERTRRRGSEHDTRVRQRRIGMA